MNLPVRNACLDEGSVLNLIRDYFELGGHAECLVSLEGYCKAPEQPLPRELAVLREMALEGKWNQVIEYLNAFKDIEDQEGLKRCQYLAHKQKFLEILHHVETDIRSKLRLGFHLYENGELLCPSEAEKIREVIEAQLTALQPLAPSPEEYLALKHLCSLPSISSSKEFSTWQLHSGRLSVLYAIGQWVSGALYLNVHFPAQQTRGKAEGWERSCSLLRLLAKGLLYEQCERLCRTRSGERKLEQGSNILDVGGWIEQQPDSSFQLPPSEICLVVNPWKKPERSESDVSLSVDMGIANRGRHLQIHHNTTASKSVSVFQHLPSNKDTNTSAEETADGSGRDPKAECVLNMAPDETAISFRPSNCKPVEDTRSDQTAAPKPIITIPVSNTVQSTGQNGVMLNTEDPLPLVQPAKAITALPSRTFGSIQQGEGEEKEREEEKGVQLSPPAPAYRSPPQHRQFREPLAGPEAASFTTTPVTKRARDSSTPKNIQASRASLKNSPPSSPIPLNLNKQRGKKSREVQKWPKATLLSSLSDPQVVRSVAFSKSGALVAVGANSRMLRLCDTRPLLKLEPCDDELPVLYQYPHYHKSSIYCLAWLGDTVLASGSNDQNIRLLTCLSDSSAAPPSADRLSFKPQKPLPLHKGTIRDMIFTSESLLVSGGGGSPEIKVTDIQTCQSVLSLAGHTEQVLALGVLPGGLLCSGAQDKTVRLWDVRTKHPISTLDVGAVVASVSSSRDVLVSAHLDGSCSVHDLNSFRHISTYTAHQDECRTVRFFPKPSQHTGWVLSGSYDGTICLTDIETLKCTKLGQHADKIIQCRWHPEGRIFTSTGADKKACFWSIG